MHAAMWANGAWTVKQQDAPNVDLAKLMALSAATAFDEDEDLSDF